MKFNALPKNASSCCPKEINQRPCMFSISLKPNYIFCSCFELFILVGLPQTMGLPSLVPVLLAMLLCTVSYTVCSSSVIFLWTHIKSYFMKNKVKLSSF